MDVESLTILREKTKDEITYLEAIYSQCTHRMQVLPAFRVAVFDYLTHNRAILDYLAHAIASYCTQSPPKIYFPLAKRGMKRQAFLDALDKTWMPGLRAANAQLFGYVDSLQWYSPGNETLTALHEMSNSNKHVKLSQMAIEECIAVVVQNPGYSGMQVGDRGFRAVTLEAGATIRFPGPAGQSLAVRGPQVIDRDTLFLSDADPGLTLTRQAWQEFKFDAAPMATAIEYLKHVRVEVERICDRVLQIRQSP